MSAKVEDYIMFKKGKNPINSIKRIDCSMKNFEEIKDQLIEFRTKYVGKISIHTMGSLEKDARIVKLVIINTLESDKEIIGRINAVIEMCRIYNQKHIDLDSDFMKEALLQFEYGVDLLLKKNKIKLNHQVPYNQKIEN